MPRSSEYKIIIIIFNIAYIITSYSIIFLFLAFYHESCSCLKYLTIFVRWFEI